MELFRRNINLLNTLAARWRRNQSECDQSLRPRRWKRPLRPIPSESGVTKTNQTSESPMQPDSIIPFESLLANCVSFLYMKINSRECPHQTLFDNSSGVIWTFTAISATRAGRKIIRIEDDDKGVGCELVPTSIVCKEN